MEYTVDNGVKFAKLSAIRYFGRLSSEAREMQLFNDVHNTMSGVTAVIDQMFYC